MTTNNINPGKIASRLAGGMRHLGPGSRGALRRMDPETPSTAFWRLSAQTIPDTMAGAGPSHTKRIAHLAKVIAIAGAIESENQGCTLGKALRLADVSETRLERLLATTNEDFGDFLERSARRLGNQRIAVNPSALGWACLAPTDETRRIIARDFYLPKTAA